MSEQQSADQQLRERKTVPIKRYDFGAMTERELPDGPYVDVEDLRAVGGPFCPESLDRCDRMCQTMCNRKAARANRESP